MNRRSPIGWAGRLLAAALCLTAGCHGGASGLPARGLIGRQVVETRVDTEIARYYLTDYLNGRRLDPIADQRIDSVYAAATNPIPDRRELRQLAHDYSLDFAALHFADRLARMPLNHRYQSAFDRILRETRQAFAAQREALGPEAAAYKVVFVPGYLYRSHRRTGADFREPREILTRLGMANAFVATDEDGPIEPNAERVADAIAAERATGKKIILVSASKSSPEAALALTRLGPGGSRQVAAWINIVGAMQGSPLADEHLRDRLQYIVGRVDPDGVRSLATPISRLRFAAFRIPPHILVVNYIGIPLSGSISPLARRGFEAIRDEGPNDGLSLLPDLLAPQAPTLIEMGSDHFLLSERMDVKTVALAAAVVEWLGPPNGKS